MTSISRVLLASQEILDEKRFEPLSLLGQVDLAMVIKTYVSERIE
jgi:hypothetical protein